MIAGLVIICLLLVLQNAWLQVRHSRERAAWDLDRRAYVSTALVAVDSGSGRGAAAVVTPRERPEPATVRPQQIDL